MCIVHHLRRQSRIRQKAERRAAICEVRVAGCGLQAEGCRVQAVECWRLRAEGDEVHAENNGKEHQADEEGPGMSSSAYESSGVDIDDEEDVALQMQTLENICTVCM